MDYKKRITAEQALEHEFFKGIKEKRNISKNKILQEKKINEDNIDVL